MPRSTDLFFCDFWRARELDDEFDEGAEFGRGKVAGGVKGVEGELLVRPVREEVDEIAAVELILNGQGQELGDAGAGYAAADQGLSIGKQKTARGVDGDDFAAAMELPLEGLARHRVAELEAMVAGEVGDLCRAAVFFQVGGGGDGDDAGFEQLPGDEEGGRGRIDEADGEIKALGGEVAKFGASEEFKRELGVEVEEAA